MAADSKTRSLNGHPKAGPRFTEFGLSDEQVQQMSLFINHPNDPRNTAEPTRHPLEEDTERWDGLA